MSVESLTSALAAGTLNQVTKARAGADSAAQLRQQAGKALPDQLAVVTVELSSSGKFKSSLSQVQTAARALATASQTSSDSDIAKAAGNLAKAVNAATPVPVAKGGLIESRGGAVASALLSIGADPIVIADLEEIGVVEQDGGTIAIEANKLAAALNRTPEAARSTLASIARQVDQTVTRELADTGPSSAVISPDKRAVNLDNRGTAQQEPATAATPPTTTPSVPSDNAPTTVNPGVAAYLRIFST